MLPKGQTNRKGENFLRFGDLIPDSTLKTMGTNKVESLIAQGQISAKDLFTGKPDAPGPESGKKSRSGKGKPETMENSEGGKE